MKHDPVLLVLSVTLFLVSVCFLVFRPEIQVSQSPEKNEPATVEQRIIYVPSADPCSVVHGSATLDYGGGMRRGGAYAGHKFVTFICKKDPI